MTPPAPQATLSYTAMRLRWCARALRAFLRRWAAYFALSALAVGAGASSGATMAAASLAAWTVLPLWRALSDGAASPWAGPAWLLQVLVGVTLLRALRPVLWPQRWREAEAALPLTRSDRWRADVAVAAVGLLPWLALQSAGALSLWMHRPAWLMPARWSVLLLWGVSQLATLGLGVLGLQQARRVRRARFRAPVRRAGEGGRAEPTHWFIPLLLRPLWRGPAQRLGAGLAVCSALLVGCAVGVAWRPPALPWWLAAWSVLALAWVPRLNTLSRQGLAPMLEEAVATLPLSALAVERGRRAVLLAPLGIGALGLSAALGLAAPAGLVRGPVLLAWGVAVWLSSLGALAAPGTDSEAASRWWISLVLLLALASEVMR